MKSILLTISIILLFLVARAQTETYRVYALKFASMKHPTPISVWADKGPDKDSVKIDFSVWLIRGNGKNILLDAGFLNDIPDAKEFEVINYIRPDSTLLK